MGEPACAAQPRTTRGRVAVAVGVRSHRGGGEMADWRALFDTVGAVGERMLGMFGDTQLGL